MGIKASKGDVIWNYLGTIMSLSGNFLLLPFMMYYLNTDLLGLWYIFLSIGGIVVLFDFGFNPTIARNVAYSWNGAKELSENDVRSILDSKPNIKLLIKVIATCKRIYLIISLVALFLLSTVGTLYIIYISDGIHGENYLVSWFIYSLAVFLNIYYGYYATLLRGVGAIKQINIATVVSRLLQILLSVIMLYSGLQLVAVAIGYLFYGFLFRILSKVFFYKYKNIGQLINENKYNVDLKEIKEIFKVVWHNAWRDGLVSLSAYLANQASVIISSIYFSLTLTGIYSISIQLVTAIATIAGSLYNAYQPSLQAAYVNRDTIESKRLMSLSMIVYTFFFWFGIMILIVGLPVLSLIKTDLEFNIPILLAISIYTFLLKHHSFYASFISNTNKVPYTKAFILSSFLSILLSIILIRFTTLGIWGLLLTQILVQAVYNNWKWPKVVMDNLQTNPFEFIKVGVHELKKVFGHH